MLPDHVLELLRNQHGLAGKHQLCASVPARSDRRTIYREPELEWATTRVLRHRAVPWSIDQELMLGVLDTGLGGVLWGKSAVCRWGFGRFRQLPPHVAVVRKSIGGKRMAQVHLLRAMDERDITVHHGIPIARPELGILWLAGMWTHRLDVDQAVQRTSIALDQAWRQGLIDGCHLHDLVGRSGGRGMSGIVAMRQVLEGRPSDYQPAGSRLEERFEDIVPGTVRSELERQVTVDAADVTRTPDFRLRTWPLLVEVNGEVFHTSLSDRAADEDRYRRFLELGFSVVVFWEHDIWHDRVTVAEVMANLARSPDPTPTLHRPTKAPWEW